MPRHQRVSPGEGKRSVAEASLNNSLTQAMRDALSEQIEEFDAALKPKGLRRIVNFGIPQAELSIYDKLPERAYSVRIWPFRIPEKVEKYRGSGV